MDFIVDMFNQLMAAFGGFFGWFFGWLIAFWNSVNRYFPAGYLTAILLMIGMVLLLMRVGLKGKQ